MPGHRRNYVIIGSQDDDFLVGTPKGDIILGRRGDDDIRAGDGDDVVIAGPGDDGFVAGGNGDDRVIGGEGDDFMVGSDGDDEVQGGAGDDRLGGDAGDDTVKGGAGNDVIDGGYGDDRLFGGAGSDTFDYNVRLDQDVDTIIAFDAKRDKLNFVDGFFDPIPDTAQQGLADDIDAISTIEDGGRGGDVTLTLWSGTVIIFRNAGTGSVDSIADLVDDPLTQITSIPGLLAG